MLIVKRLLAAIALLMLVAAPAAAADKKISELTAASTLDGTESVPVVQAGTTKKATVDQVAQYVGVKVLAQSSGEVSHTGDTAEFALATVTIPAGAMGANGRIEVWAQFRYSNSANAKTIRARFGGTGGTVYASSAPTTTTAQGLIFYVANLNSASSQFGASMITTATSGATSAVDTSSATTLVLSGQLANSSDTVTLSNYRVLLFPKG